MKWLLLILLLLAAIEAPARDLVKGGPNVEGIRPAGMGNAFLALADDANALFYNPAGLSQVKQVHINLLDFEVGFDNGDTLNRMRRAVFDSEFDNLLRRDMQFMRAGMAPKFLFPYMGFSVFNNMRGYFDMRDLPGRGLNVYGLNDLGAIFGFGVPLSPYFSLGLSTKFLYRSAIDVEMTPADLVEFITLDDSAFASQMQDYLREQSSLGWGIGFDVGALVKVPTAGKNSNTLQLAAVIRDLGHTTFRNIGSADTPPPTNQTYNFGAAMQFPLAFGKVRGGRRGELAKSSVLNLAADYQQAFENIGWHKQLKLGFELKHPVFGLRIGAHHGYPTFGASIEFPPHTRLHFATYAVELGNQIWTNQQRWYQVQLTIGFNPL